MFDEMPRFALEHGNKGKEQPLFNRRRLRAAFL